MVPSSGIARSAGGRPTGQQLIEKLIRYRRFLTFRHPLRFCITLGQASDVTTAPNLLDGQKAGAIVADNAYDSNDLRERIVNMNAKAVIPSKRNRKVFIPHDTAIYKHRNLIERCFGRLKHLRRFGYDRRTIHFTGFIHLAADMIRLR